MTSAPAERAERGPEREDLRVERAHVDAERPAMSRLSAVAPDDPAERGASQQPADRERDGQGSPRMTIRL